MAHPQPRRAIAAALGAVVSVLLIAGPAAADPPSPADAAATWLAGKMVDGDHFEAVFGPDVFPDQGLTLDAVIAFAATTTGDTNGADALTWLAQSAILSGYIGDGTGESYAGSLAKSSLAVQIRGGDPTAFGGVDLITRLRARLAPSGRFSDASAFGDFSNTLGQSFAILSLARTAEGAPPSAVDFLLANRCADHGFPLDFGKPTCVSSVDATALAVQALVVTGHSTDAASAIDWLLSVQAASGAFRDYSPTGSFPLNANSTGLAGQALRACGQNAAADKAGAYLITQQIPDSAPADQGAIVYKAADPSDPSDPGGLDGRAARATAQAIPALAEIPLGEIGITKPGATPDRPVCVGPPPPAAPFLPVTGDSLQPVIITGAALLLVGMTLLIGLRLRRRTVR